MRALLDIDVLLALLDSEHLDHRRARARPDEEIDPGWASCAIGVPATASGTVRRISGRDVVHRMAPARST